MIQTDQSNQLNSNNSFRKRLYGQFPKCTSSVRFLQQIASVTWVRDLRFGVLVALPAVAFGNRGCFIQKPCVKPGWLGSLDWLQRHNMLYGTELAETEEIGESLDLWMLAFVTTRGKSAAHIDIFRFGNFFLSIQLSKPFLLGCSLMHPTISHQSSLHYSQVIQAGPTPFHEQDLEWWYQQQSGAQHSERSKERRVTSECVLIWMKLLVLHLFVAPWAAVACLSTRLLWTTK